MDGRSGTTASVRHSRGAYPFGLRGLMVAMLRGSPCGSAGSLGSPSGFLRSPPLHSAYAGARAYPPHCFFCRMAKPPYDKQQDGSTRCSGEWQRCRSGRHGARPGEGAGRPGQGWKRYRPQGGNSGQPGAPLRARAPQKKIRPDISPTPPTTPAESHSNRKKRTARYRLQRSRTAIALVRPGRGTGPQKKSPRRT